MVHQLLTTQLVMTKGMQTVLLWYLLQILQQHHLISHQLLQVSHTNSKYKLEANMG